MKLNIWFLLLLILGFFHQRILLSQEPESNSNMTTRDQAGKTAKTLDLGSIGKSVNQFTGDVSLTIPLVELSGKHGLGVDVTLNYNSNIHSIINVRNKNQQASWVGLGWSLNVSGLPLKIISNHNNTQDVSDDIYYLDGSVRLIYKSNVTTNVDLFLAENSIFTKFERYFNSTDKVIDKWIVTMQDGSQLEFGGTTDSRSRLLVWGNNWVGSSRNAPSGYVNHIWHLNKVTNIHNESLVFEYDHEDDLMTSGVSYTRANYIKKVTDTYGRQVIFNTALRDANEYEDFYNRYNTEPDAYMEEYEKKYLDQIIVKNSDGSTIFSYDLTYTTQSNHFVVSGCSTNMTDKFRKRQLIEIKQYDKNGTGQPSTYFSYLANTASYNPGALSEVTNSNGAKVKYEYMQKQTLSSLNRTLGTIPDGVSGRIWFNPNYIVYLNRQGNNINVYAYYWTGYQWEGSPNSVFTITNAENEWDKNKVFLGDDFFVVLKRSEENDYRQLYIFSWDKITRQWIHDSNQDIFTNHSDVRMSIGKKYIAVVKENGGTFWRRYYDGNKWINRDTTLAYYEFGKVYRIHGQSDYFILVDMVPTNDKVYRYWYDQGKLITSSTLTISGDNNYDVIYCGDFYIVSMEDDGGEKVYRWNSQNQWITTDPGISNADDQDPVYCVGPVFLIVGNNQLEAYRFTGNGWERHDYTIDYGDRHGYVNLGNDYFVIYDHYANSEIGYIRSYNYDPDLTTGWPATYNQNEANGNAWRSIPLTYNCWAFNNDIVSGHASKFYRLNPLNTNWWDVENTVLDADDRIIYLSEDMYLQNEYIDGVAYYIKLIRFNQKTYTFDSPVSLGQVPDRWNGLSHYNNIATFTGANTYLYKLINMEYTGYLKDYPVQYVRISPDGDNNFETTYQYAYDYGRFDPSCSVTQYNKCTIFFPDNNGKSETYFFNGLCNSDNSSITFPTEKNGSNMGTMYTLMTGQPYRINTYEQGNSTPVTESVNYYKAEKLDNALDIWVVRPVQQESYTTKNSQTKVMTTTYTYDPDNDVPGATITTTQEDSKIIKYSYTNYAAKTYSDMKNTYNMLTQVYENYTKIDNLYYSDSWTVYEQKTVNGKTTYLPTKNRTWIASTPSATKPTYSLSYPGADVSYDAAGNIYETFNTKANGYSCNLYLSNTLPIASFSNTTMQTSSKNNVIADEFGDGNVTDNYPLSWTTASGWSVVNGELKADNSGLNALKAVPAVNMTNFNAEFDLKIYDDAGNGASYGGLEFRKTSQSHTFENSGYIVYLKANGLIGLYKNGSTIQEVQTGITSKKAHIKITGQGNSIKVFADGIQFITATDASFNGNYLGFRINGAKCWFDNLVVYTLDASYTLQSYDASTLDVLYKIDANGQKVSYEYDSLGRLIKVRGPNGEILKEVNYKLSSEQ